MRNEKGVVLIMSLMIMFLVTISGLLLSTMIINSIKSTRTSGQAITAYYGAESGMELALYLATQGRLAKSKISAVGPEIESKSGVMTLAGLSFGLSAEYDTSKTEVVTYLPENQTFSLDLFDVEDSFADKNVRKVKINWKDINKKEWIEVSWIGWKSDGSISASEKRVYVNADKGETGVIVDVSDEGQYIATRLRVKALRSGVNNLKITALDVDDSPVSIPRSRMTITATGSFETAKQALTADIHWVLPLSPLFDYAIFSESPLMK